MKKIIFIFIIFISLFSFLNPMSNSVIYLFNKDFNITLDQIRHKPNISILSLAFYYHLKDEMLEMIINECPSNLECLDLAYCSKITDRSILTMLNKLKNLRLLNLSFCSNLTENSLIPTLLNFPKLEIFGIEENKNITDQFIEVLKEKCPRIRFLDVSNTQITFQTISNFKIHYPKCKIIYPDPTYSDNPQNIVYLPISSEDILKLGRNIYK